MYNLKDTTNFMNSNSYRERFIAEYWQVKIRYEKLKAFNNKIEASKKTNNMFHDGKKIEMPTHDCPDDLLRQQQSVMGEYLRLLEVRAVIEDINLNYNILTFEESSCMGTPKSN